MAPKAAQQNAQKKAAKQKKLLIALSVPAAAALFFAVHTFMSLNSHPSDTPVSATPVAATTPTTAIPSATSTTTTPVVPGVSAVPVSALHSFAALGRKDPFNDHGPNPGAAPAPKSSGSGSGKGKSKGKAGGSGATKGGGSKQPPAPLTGAVISINGTKLALAIGTKFGHAPGLSGVWLFRLVKVAPRSALISVVGTTQTFTLHVRQPLTLEQNGGWRYTLILEPLGSAAPMTVQTSTTTTTTGP